MLSTDEVVTATSAQLVTTASATKAHAANLILSQSDFNQQKIQMIVNKHPKREELQAVIDENFSIVTPCLHQSHRARQDKTVYNRMDSNISNLTRVLNENERLGGDVLKRIRHCVPEILQTTFHIFMDGLTAETRRLLNTTDLKRSDFNALSIYFYFELISENCCLKIKKALTAHEDEVEEFHKLLDILKRFEQEISDCTASTTTDTTKLFLQDRLKETSENLHMYKQFEHFDVSELIYEIKVATKMCLTLELRKSCKVDTTEGNGRRQNIIKLLKDYKFEISSAGIGEWIHLFAKIICDLKETYFKVSCYITANFLTQDQQDALVEEIDKKRQKLNSGSSSSHVGM